MWAERRRRSPRQAPERPLAPVRRGRRRSGGARRRWRRWRPRYRNRLGCVRCWCRRGSRRRGDRRRNRRCHSGCGARGVGWIDAGRKMCLHTWLGAQWGHMRHRDGLGQGDTMRRRHTQGSRVGIGRLSHKLVHRGSDVLGFGGHCRIAGERRRCGHEQLRRLCRVHRRLLDYRTQLGQRRQAR